MSMTSAAFSLDRARRTPKFTLALHTGRLLELRVMEHLRAASELAEFSDLIWEQIEKTRERIVICADYRRVPMLLSPDRAEEWGAMMSATAPRVERSAILLDRQKPTLNLQLQRVVSGAGNRGRKLFFDETEAKDFLGGALDDAERARLSRFLRGET